LELIGAVIALCASLMATVQTILENQALSDANTLPQTNATGTSRNNDEFASIAGLSLSFAIGVTGLLNWTVRSFAQMEAGMNSTERILHYTNNIPTEKKDGLTAEKNSDVLKNWPTNGTIIVNDLKMRYRKGTELVLKGVDFTIQSGQRVGVVGRTGAGKSSLMLCLLRLVEPELNNGDGPIVWDGIDTSKLSLKTLRTKIGIIPQTPTLFSGKFQVSLLFLFFLFF
jgi:ATP-binding cassette subfamily C (CFTR/MRP) protein 1